MRRLIASGLLFSIKILRIMFKPEIFFVYKYTWYVTRNVNIFLNIIIILIHPVLL